MVQDLMDPVKRTLLSFGHRAEFGCSMSYLPVMLILDILVLQEIHKDQI